MEQMRDGTKEEVDAFQQRILDLKARGQTLKVLPCCVWCRLSVLWLFKQPQQFEKEASEVKSFLLLAMSNVNTRFVWKDAVSGLKSQCNLRYLKKSTATDMMWALSIMNVDYYECGFSSPGNTAIFSHNIVMLKTKLETMEFVHEVKSLHLDVNRLYKLVVQAKTNSWFLFHKQSLYLW